MPRTFRHHAGFYWAGDGETKDGSLTWLMGALGIPDYPGDVHSYGSVIGTGNAVVEWNPAWKEGCAMSAVVGLICQVYLIHFFNLKEIHLGERFARVLKACCSSATHRCEDWTLGFVQYAVVLDFGSSSAGSCQSGVDTCRSGVPSLGFDAVFL